MCKESATTILVKKKVKEFVEVAGVLLCNLETDFPSIFFTHDDVLKKYADKSGYLKNNVAGLKGTKFRVLNLLGILVQNENLEQLGNNFLKIKVP
jgi:hypothetical protein